MQIRWLWGRVAGKIDPDGHKYFAQLLTFDFILSLSLFYFIFHLLNLAT
jgi:hypothetical protein